MVSQEEIETHVADGKAKVIAMLEAKHPGAPIAAIADAIETFMSHMMAAPPAPPAAAAKEPGETG